MRSPLQGGLPPVGSPAGAVVEIACDESGFSGTNLLDPVTPTITHASVDLAVEEAAALITALRSGFRFSPNEFKSGQFLRNPGAPEALEWFLAALRGRARVHLVDKEYFLATRIVDLFLAEPSYAAGTSLTQEHRPAALALYRAGRPAGAGWVAFLAAFVELVRIKRRHRPDPRALDRFFRARDELARDALARDALARDALARDALARDALARDALARDALATDALVQDGIGAAAEDVLGGLSPARVWDVLTRLGDDPSIPPPLEPMVPAVAETVLLWSGGRRQVLVIHDEQSALTAGRLRRLQQVLADASAPAGAAHPARVSPLAGLVMVDSRDDPRVQVADLLAGVARRSPALVDGGPLRPFLSPTSLRDPGRPHLPGRGS